MGRSRYQYNEEKAVDQASDEPMTVTNRAVPLDPLS